MLEAGGFTNRNFYGRFSEIGEPGNSTKRMAFRASPRPMAKTRETGPPPAL